MRPGLPLLPDGRATLGVLGGGQLGAMFVHAAQSLGYRCAVLDPDPDSPAGGMAQRHLRAAYDATAALDELAAGCDAVTTEFENVPAAALRALAASRPVAPSAAAVQVCQDRAEEKTHFARAGVPCAPWARVERDADLVRPEVAALLPGILKTARLGYDGKGQWRVADAAALAAAWQTAGGAACVLEALLPLRLELSVVLARGHDGRSVHLPVQQNLHRDGILAVTQAPAPDVDAALAAEAVSRAVRLADGLGYVGVLCVEFFVLHDGRLLANEMAPRPHNSGHHSLDSCSASQFELQVRALAGLPLPAPRQHSPAVMLNLLGDLWAGGTPDWPAVLALPGTRLHLYGKRQARPGRKMGHLTVTAGDAATARAVALQAAALLGLPAF